jgi:hypothetical protein
MSLLPCTTVQESDNYERDYDIIILEICHKYEEGLDITDELIDFLVVNNCVNIDEIFGMFQLSNNNKIKICSEILRYNITIISDVAQLQLDVSKCDVLSILTYTKDILEMGIINTICGVVEGNNISEEHTKNKYVNEEHINELYCILNETYYNQMMDKKMLEEHSYSEILTQYGLTRDDLQTDILREFVDLIDNNYVAKAVITLIRKSGDGSLSVPPHIIVLYIAETNVTRYWGLIDIIITSAGEVLQTLSNLYTNEIFKTG